ncbi:MAG: NAD-dependent epimerase/dehydratase family protein [Candidatus Neomarinimicrobiota bacterium]
MGKRNKILVTGCAGFIGMHLCNKLLQLGYSVIGLDNLNDYYDVNLKIKRLSFLQNNPSFKFLKTDISNKNSLEDVFKNHRPNKVVNLAAQAGVRYSLVNPHSYVESNIVGFMNILECCRHYGIEGLIYASSSSVYGGNKKIPFSESDNVDNPISIYAVSKKANELMAHSYNHLFGIRSTGLRFFTVYGPWGRPDMAMYIFANKILKNEPIEVFNDGQMKRDFTFIDDIVDGIVLSIKKNYNKEVFNLGNNKSEDLMDIVSMIEKKIGKKAKVILKPMQLGDVEKTYADIGSAKEKLGYYPKTDVQEGIDKFIDWFVESSTQ